MRLLLMLLLTTTAPIRPNPALTPGAIDATLTASTLCSSRFHTATVRNVSSTLKGQVFARYGIDPRSGRFEVDHLISLELGGANTIENLWPQSYETAPLNATIKDGLENRLHHLVCTQAITLAEAQQAIRTDWVAAYRMYLCDAHVSLTALQATACAALSR